MTPPQHLEALERANRIRLHRAAIKRDLKAGRLTVPELMQSAPPEMARMTMGELLRSQRRWGRARARKFLNRVAISEARTMEHMTPRQRELVAAELR
jgi:hypothetical protein